MLLFRLYEKVTKRDDFYVLFAKRTKRMFFCYFLRRAKSNQKHAEGFGPLDSGERFKIPSSELLTKTQILCLSRNFYENLQPCAIQLGIF